MATQKSKPQILRHGRTADGREVWEVESRSEAGAFYMVTLQDGHLSCQCPGYQYRGKCAHIAAVEEARIPAYEKAGPVAFSKGNEPFSIFKYIPAGQQPRQREEW